MRIAVMPHSGSWHCGVACQPNKRRRVQLNLSTHCSQADVLQAVLQGPRQNFRLPVADFKQAVLDAQNGVQGPGGNNTGLKVRLPMGKGSSVGHASKLKGQPHGARNKPPGQGRCVIHAGSNMLQCRPGLPVCCPLACSQCSSTWYLYHDQLALLSKSNRD